MTEQVSPRARRELEKLIQLQGSIDKAYLLIESLRQVSSLIKQNCPEAARLEIQHRRNKS